MKVAVYKAPRKIALEETEKPQPERGKVVIDVRACGICGSDLHFYRNEWKPKEFAGGHEFVGVIEEIGEGVEDFKVGDRVCVECFTYCGECRYCRAGHYNLCLNRRFDASRPGGFAEYTLADANSLYRLPDDFSFEMGALIEPLAVSYRAFRRASPVESVLIIGAGTIGLMALAVARRANIGNIIIIAKYPHQADVAREFGATHIIMSDEEEIAGRIKELTNGLGAEAVVETIASAATVNLALTAARRMGTVSFVGGFTDGVRAKLGEIVSKELCVVGSCCYGFSGLKTDFQWAMEIISSGIVPFERLITHRFDLDEISEAFRVACDKQTGAIKVLVCQPRD